MKIVFRTLAILAVAMLVVGASVALNGSTGSTGQAAPPQGERAPEGFPTGGLRLGDGGEKGAGEGGREHGEGGGASVLTPVLRSLLIVGAFTLIGVLLMRGIKALTGQILNPTPTT